MGRRKGGIRRRGRRLPAIDQFEKADRHAHRDQEQGNLDQAVFRGSGEHRRGLPIGGAGLGTTALRLFERGVGVPAAASSAAGRRPSSRQRFVDVPDDDRCDHDADGGDRRKIPSRVRGHSSTLPRLMMISASVHANPRE